MQPSSTIPREFSMNYRIRTTLALAAALLFTGCDDDGTGPSRTVQGSLTFAYAGHVQGSFDATNTFTVPDPGSGAFAAGRLGAIRGSARALTVLGRQPIPGDDALANEVLIAVRDPEPGTVTCDLDETGCPFSAFFFAEVAPSGETAGYYGANGGTVTITSLENGRARGTFSFELVELTLSAGPTLQITSGSFDVPILADSEI